MFKKFKPQACVMTIESIPEGKKLYTDTERLLPFVEALNKELAAERISEPGVYKIVFMKRIPLTRIFKYSVTKL